MDSLFGWATPAFLMWLSPLVFLIHDGEEIATVERWGQAHLPALRTRFGSRRLFAAVLDRAVGTNTARFAITVACILVGSIAASYLGTAGWPVWFAAVLAIRFVNVLTHVGQTLLFGGYTPGVVTAMLVVLPYSLYTYVRLFAAGVFSWSLVWRSLPLGLVGVVVLFALGHLVGRALFPPKPGDRVAG